MNPLTAPSQTSHCEQYPGELFRGNMTQHQFNELALDQSDKRMGVMAFDGQGRVIHKGDEPSFAWVYPVFVRREAIEQERRTTSGLAA